MRGLFHWFDRGKSSVNDAARHSVLGFDPAGLRGATGFTRIQALADAVEAV
jgi:hypothetical protein